MKNLKKILAIILVIAMAITTMITGTIPASAAAFDQNNIGYVIICLDRYNSGTKDGQGNYQGHTFLVLLDNYGQAEYFSFAPTDENMAWLGTLSIKNTSYGGKVTYRKYTHSQVVQSLRNGNFSGNNVSEYVIVEVTPEQGRKIASYCHMYYGDPPRYRVSLTNTNDVYVCDSYVAGA